MATSTTIPSNNALSPHLLQAPLRSNLTSVFPASAPSHCSQNYLHEIPLREGLRLPTAKEGTSGVNRAVNALHESADFRLVEQAVARIVAVAPAPLSVPNHVATTFNVSAGEMQEPGRPQEGATMTTTAEASYASGDSCSAQTEDISTTTMIPTAPTISTGHELNHDFQLDRLGSSESPIPSSHETQKTAVTLPYLPIAASNMAYKFRRGNISTIGIHPVFALFAIDIVGTIVTNVITVD
ncbi:hypothetical protein BCR41DRAFT_368170 [Lobosporangium transversale]|uniref:Uncharacterized protein n=1 Tax=Lobosporangium transversale TaxID=64571 RepID=A0A1Y2GWE3_9FUNG|nr:hypothetical protein BCR41DRAFT_368170 [Lobosporangium transversale]ORZ26618.1 hypothetical protein BCR41DRAFT_368170 [Lobosporangium transversale]|eukprot:XP_021884381.1 hypothetical protein BCR41DRAFT_368170 [Lobosporangium transversale]